MRAYVDPDLCISCGLCTSIESEVFELGEDGVAHAVADTTDGNRDRVEEAIESCPTDAIRAE